jgi:hypothetical protein
MSFDREAFAAKLQADFEEITKCVYFHRLVNGKITWPKEIAHIRVVPGKPERDNLFIEGTQKRNPTAHEKLEDIKSLQLIKTLARQITERIAQEAPILADPDYTVEISIGPSIKAGCKAALTISGRNIGEVDAPQMAEDVAKRTALALERISGIPGGPRMFQFPSGDRIHARTPKDAYRAHIALCHPSLFEASSKACKKSYPSISEVLDNTDFINSLQD